MMKFWIVVVMALLLGFLFYRYRKYQQQRHIDELAAQAHAVVSSEIVELLQRFKTLRQQGYFDRGAADSMQADIKNMTNNLFCDTDSEASIREYLMMAKQEIALINQRLEQAAQGIAHSPSDEITDADFEALKF